MEITRDLEDERPSCSIVLVLLVDSPCKPIIAVRQEANYMQPFHPLAKKIKCLYIWAGCRFFDKIFCQKMLASHLFAVLAVCQAAVLSFQMEFLTKVTFLIENLNLFPGLLLYFAFKAIG